MSRTKIFSGFCALSNIVLLLSNIVLLTGATAGLGGCTSEPAAPATKATSQSFAGSNIKTGDGTTRTKTERKVDAVCAANSRKCSSVTAEAACAADGSQWVQVACGGASACEDGQCRPTICQPGSKACDGNDVVTCGTRGVSVASRVTCSPDQACVGGGCIAMTCKPGTTTCSGNAVATCNADGMGWQANQCASDASCDVDPATKVAACQEQVCAAGAAVCKEGRVMQCDGKGLHEVEAADCGAKGQACVDGACAEYVCQTGQTGCDGVNVATCAAGGVNWAISACPTGQACNNGACAAVTCVANEIFCNGNEVALCNGTGTAAETQVACTAKQTCKQGKCVVATIVCGDGLCDADESISCTKDCKPITLLSPDFDKVPPGVATVLPGAPRPLTKPALPASLTGKGVAIHGQALFVVDAENGKLVRLDRLTLQVVQTIAMPGRPQQLVVDNAGTAFVTARDTGMVHIVAWGSDKVTASWKVGTEPWGIALSADQKALFVSLTGENAVVQIDPKSGSEVGRAVTLSRPKAISASPSGTVYVVHGDGTLSVAAPAAFVAKSESITAPTATSVALRTNNPCPACQGLVTKKVRVANRAQSITIDPETEDVYVPHVLVASGSAEDVMAGAGIKPPEKPQQFVTKCSGGYGSTCSQVPVPPPPGEPPCVGVPLRPYELTVSKIAPSGQIKATMPSGPVFDVASGRAFLARFDQPIDIVYHPTASMMFVAAKGTNSVLVLNSAAPDPMQWPMADIKVADGPQAMAIAPNGKTLYVVNANAFSVSEVDLTPLVAMAQNALIVDKDAALPKIAPMFLKATKSLAYGTDPLSPEAQLGRKVFHHANNSRLSASNRFACATCHIDGTEDKQVWFIAEGPRQTPALAERLIDTAPYNWMGSKLTLHENIIGTTARMGGSGLLPTELEGLMQFLFTGLKAPPNPNLKPEGLTPQQLAGKKLFNDPETKCASCHVPGSLTDAAQHDVGTLTTVEVKVAEATGKPTNIVYNTPSLRGLFYSAPYLHDGSAPTLKAALQKTATTMGKTSQLSAQQLDDLVAYLLTL